MPPISPPKNFGRGRVGEVAYHTVYLTERQRLEAELAWVKKETERLLQKGEYLTKQIEGHAV